MNYIKKILIGFFLLCLTECAIRGIPNGGPEDETPPVLINAIPEENSTNFNKKRIRLFFDEYIKLDDFRKQLVVSPPIEKNLYTISPQSGASKYIQIDINGILEKNTTYVFNFGQSVVDNNEGNILPFFKYVFSTGNFIDSLKLSGNIKSALKRSPDKFISTLLYAVDENFSDSIVYNSTPTYIGSTLDSTFFEISNIKKGKYLLIALNDFNNNYKFDPNFEEIGFLRDFINIPSSDEINIDIFKQEPVFKSFKPFVQSKNKIGFGFIGKHDNVKIELLDSFSKNFKSITTKSRDTDTLNFWFNDIKYDSLRFLIKNNDKTDFYTVKYKDRDKDSLIITSLENSIINLNDTLKLLSNIPISKVDEDLILLENKDSISIPFKTKIDENNLDIVFDFEMLPNDNYRLAVFPNAIIDFLGSTNDTIKYNFSTKKKSDYGTINLKVENSGNYPIIIQLTDLDEKIVRQKILNSSFDPCIFKNLNPGKYFLKAIIDENKNNKWDTGVFLEKLFPEKTFHFTDEINVRANWILEEKLTIK